MVAGFLYPRIGIQAQTKAAPPEFRVGRGPAWLLGSFLSSWGRGVVLHIEEASRGFADQVGAGNATTRLCCVDACSSCRGGDEAGLRWVS